ncbi:MAG: PAS domain-containing protein, partial [Methanomicrobiales archaeon]|nr:PAS domain-containing protein [Methanomicrobiales archaeon]
GKRIGAIESIRDITDWKQIENARENALQRREASVHESRYNRENIRLPEERSPSKTSNQIATTIHRAVLDATDLVFILNSDGRILFANQSAEKLLENAPGKITGRSILSFIADEFRIQILKIFSGSSKNPETLPISFNTPTGVQPVVGSISFFSESAENPRQILLICKKKT